jgi:bacteriorhodopsin
MQSAEKPTRLGTISLILSIIVVVLWCVFFILFGVMTEGGVTFGMDSETAGYTLILGGGTVLAALTILLTLTGLILGILARRKKDPKRGIAITGLALNFLCFAPYCLFFLLIALGGLSTADLSKYIPSFGP